MAAALGPQKRLVAKPRCLFEKHRRQTAAAVVIHPSSVPFHRAFMGLMQLAE
jgi:hypothetical protein